MGNRSGRAVLLVLGLGGSSLETRPLVARLREHDFHVETFRFTLSGTSNAHAQGEDFGASYLDWISAGNAAVDLLASRYREINLCGVGLGATLAIAIAAERATVIDSLTIISTLLYRDGWNVPRWHRLLTLLYYTPLRHLIRIQERPPYGVKNMRNRAWMSEQFEIGSLSLWGGSLLTGSWLREVDRLMRHARRVLGRVRSPTLMIHAREDDVASVSNVHYARTHIGTDLFTEIIVENSYHLLFFDNDCDFAVTRTIQFINTRAELWANAALTRP